MQAYYNRTAPAREAWECYLQQQSAPVISFDWRSLLGTPPKQTPDMEESTRRFSYEEKNKINYAKMQLRLKENIKAKIAPLAKAYGMKSNWSDIQSVLCDVSTEKINRKFDETLTFLAEEVFPQWNRVDCLETFFAPERQNYFEAMRI